MRSILILGVSIVLVGYGVVVCAVYALPHLPLANDRTFYALLRAQIAVDHSSVLKKDSTGMVLFLGSSVVERGISEAAVDTELHQAGLRLVTTNAGTGGFCAEANLPMFRAMLAQGLKPAIVVYGVCLQELNALSSVHASIGTDDTNSIKLRSKSLWNVIKYGPTALHPLLQPDHFHQYIFAANNAFRDVPNLTFIDKLMFGQNMYGRDTMYRYNPTFLKDLEEIISLCKAYKIQVAFYNAPLKPRPLMASAFEVPFQHRKDSYERILSVCDTFEIPLWNFDRKEGFPAKDFQDNYHLNPQGAKAISHLLGQRIVDWKKGLNYRDPVSSLD